MRLMAEIDPRTAGAARPISWRRGLFRLWIVLSVIWMGTSIWYFDPLSHFKTLHRTIILTHHENRIEFPANLPLNVIKKSLIDWIEKQQVEIKR